MEFERRQFHNKSSRKFNFCHRQRPTETCHVIYTVCHTHAYVRVHSSFFFFSFSFPSSIKIRTFILSDLKNSFNYKFFSKILSTDGDRKGYRDQFNEKFSDATARIANFVQSPSNLQKPSTALYFEFPSG